MTPPAMAPLRAGLPLVPGVLVEFEGLRPNGQKSPPLGGRTQVRESPSPILTKFDEIDIDVVVLTSVINGAGLGKESNSGQLGPRAPMNDQFPKKLFPCTVKFVAEVMAIP